MIDQSTENHLAEDIAPGDIVPEELPGLIFIYAGFPSQLFDCFEACVNELQVPSDWLSDYELIELEDKYAVAVKKKMKSSFIEYLSCINFWPQAPSTAVKVEIEEKSGQSCCQIKALSGSKVEVQAFLAVFRSRIGENSMSFQPFLISERRQAKTQIAMSPFQCEAYTTYTISQALLQPGIPIANLAAKMLNDFRSSFKNPAESAQQIPLPMKNAVTISEQLTGELQKQFHFLPYLRIAVENFVFSHVESLLRASYEIRNAEVQQTLAQKRPKIWSKYSLKELLIEVALNQRFWCVDHIKMDERLDSQLAREAISFGACSKELSKICHCANPREKIKYIEMMYSNLKTFFFKGTKQKYELSSMEDIIPVMIVIILLADVPYLRTELDLMSDFIAADSLDMETQKRLLVNLSESYNYIVRDWVV